MPVLCLWGFISSMRYLNIQLHIEENGFLVLLLLLIKISLMRKLVAARGRMFRAIGGFVPAQRMESEEFVLYRLLLMRIIRRNFLIEIMNASVKLKQKTLKIPRNMAISNIFTNMLPVISLLGGSQLTLNGQMSSGGLFSFILLTNVMLMPIQMLTDFSVRFPNGMAGFKNFLGKSWHLQAPRVSAKLPCAEEGISEEGSHDELMRTGGMYSSLYRVQAV